MTTSMYIGRIMILRHLWTFTLASIRMVLVGAVVLAVGLSGATAAHRIYFETARAQAAIAAEQAKLVPQPSETAAQGTMAKGSGPSSEQAAFSTPVGVGPERDTRVRGTLPVSSDSYSAVIIQSEYTPPLNSSGMVSSRLAEQFTLLGAKPSGTM